MAESIFKIKVSNGSINIELEGKSEIVIEQFNEIRRTGLEKFLTGGANPKAAPRAAEKAAFEPAKTEGPKKRGRKPKNQLTPDFVLQTTEPVTTKKVTKNSPAAPKPATVTAGIPAKKGRPAKVKPVVDLRNDVITEEAPSKTTKTLKAPAAKKGPAKVSTRKAKTSVAKAIKQKPTKKSKTSAKGAIPVEVNLNLLPTLEEVCNANRPGPEREWILIYALYASESGKRTISRDDIVLKYEETGRKDQSKINNLTNNIANAVKKGWIDHPGDKKFYITPLGIKIAFDIATRTEPIKVKKTGKVPKKPRVIPEPKAETIAEVKTAEEPISAPVLETALQVVKKAKKAKSKSVKKAKSKKKPIRKTPVKVEEPKPETTE